MERIDYDAPHRTYLDLLRAELADYERRKAKAAAMLAGDDDYHAKVLAGWDHAIGVKQAQIQREQQRVS